MPDGTGQTVGSVERALDVLSLFSDAEAADLGVTEIAEALGLSKAVVHRILASCRSRGYVELDESSRRYRLGPSSLDLGLSYLHRVDALRDAHESLTRLSDLTDETATQSVRAGWQRVYVDQVTPSRDIKMMVQIGGSYPLHAGATGKALLSGLNDELVEAFLTQVDLTPVTDQTITDVDQLREDIAEIRARGYAVSLGERQSGAGSVAAPVRNHSGHAVGAISVCGPVERIQERVDVCADALLTVVGDISKRLGYRG